MTQMQALKCPSCNASLDYDGRSETIRCEFCGTTIIVPENMRAGAYQAGYMGGESPEKAQAIHQILELVHHGQKIEAIKLYRETFGVGLKEAKDIVDGLEMGKPTAVTVTTISPSTGNSSCGCIVGIVILLFTLGIVVAAMVPFFSITQIIEDPGTFIQQVSEGEFETFVEEMGSQVAIINRNIQNSPIVTTGGGDGLGADLIVENWQYANNSNTILLSYTEASDSRRTTRWEAEVGDSSNNLGFNVGFDNQQVYYTSGSTLYALNRASGEQVWQANLSDVVDKRCYGCLRSDQGVVVALTADNTLYGLNATTGQTLWQARLESDTPIYLEEGFVGLAILKDKVAVLDESEKAGTFGYALKLYDINSGELSLQLVPMCPDIDNFFDPSPFGYYDQIFIDEAQDRLFFLWGESINGPECLEEWNPDTGQPVWQTRLPGDDTGISSSIGRGIVTEWNFSPYFAFNGQTLMLPAYESSSQGVALVDLSSGAIQFNLRDDDYEMWPIGVQGDTAVIWVERQRGTTQVEVWGVNKTTGERLWQHTLTAEYLFDMDPFDDRWTYQLTANGLYILQLFATPDPPELLVQSLNTVTGALNYEVKNNLSSDYWEGLTRTPSHVYLTLDTLVGVDLSNGEAATEWP
ncbi:MAG: ribosomal protein L7/L12 [Anaerolineae bacterium]|nr:ribosomal protein L7/L12 [Anaerolineae bacterium]